MGQEDDFVIISHSDVQDSSPQRVYPRPYSREFMQMYHNMHDEHRRRQALTISTACGSSLPDLDAISSYIDSLAPTLWPINHKIHDNPELGFKEFIAHDTLTKFMQSQHGWKVTPSAYGMETAWVAEYNSGKKGPVVSFNAEMGQSLQTTDQMRLSREVIGKNIC